MNLIISSFADDLITYVLASMLEYKSPHPRSPDSTDPSFDPESFAVDLSLTALRFFESVTENKGFITSSAVTARLPEIVEHLVSCLVLTPQDVSDDLSLEDPSVPADISLSSQQGSHSDAHPHIAGSHTSAEPSLPLGEMPETNGRGNRMAAEEDDDDEGDDDDSVDNDEVDDFLKDDEMMRNQIRDAQYTPRIQASSTLTTLFQLFDRAIVSPLLAIFFHISVCFVHSFHHPPFSVS